MNLQDELQLSVTKEKLSGLKERYESIRQETGGDEFVREVTLRSLKKLINQLTEEIARYEAHAGGVK
ncbi:MAG TPA: hypothetical protein VIH42_01335 [Thermoguttaceae bacterium]